MPVSTEKRASPRIRQRTNLTIASSEHQNHQRAQMHNYSRDGLFFVSSEDYQPGDQLRVYMDNFDPGAQGPAAFRSYLVEVKNCRRLENDEGDHFGVGVCYLYKSKEDLPHLTPARRLEVSPDRLRRRAEQFLAEHADTIPEIAASDSRQILHDLQVHQIELEMQNEELRRAQNEIETALAKYTDLYDFAPVSYFTIDSKGLIQNVNLTATTLLGVDRRHLIGKPFGVFVAPEDKDVFWVHRQSVIDTHIRQSIEIRLKHHDGNPIFVSLESSPVPATQAEHLHEGILSALIDITERKKTEEECKRLEECLAEAKKMEAIGTLAGGVAHDFNNLLMGIQGYVSLMREDLENTPPYAGYLKNVNEMITSAAALTRQLLGFAQGGKYNPHPIDINVRIKKGVEFFERTRKDVQIITDLQDDLWAVEADQSQIDQVLLNLFINASDAMPDGGRFEISTANLVLKDNPTQPFPLPPGNYIQIAASDTGIGMDDKTRKRIFEPFYTTKQLGRGTGLGLASVYGIIRNHKGHIQVFSKLLKGSTFIINLPASAADIKITPRIPAEMLTGTETVLLVDDEPIVREVGATMLERLGYHVLLAESGKEALKLFRQNQAQIALVVLDMIMPGMNGRETYDQLRMLDPGVKVLLASGYSQTEAADEILQLGGRGFIQKPYSLKEFSQVLRQILDTN